MSVESSRDDVLELLGRASAVVTMAGYNSLCEVLAARKKALVVPRAGPSQEQRIRCQLFSERNLIRVLDPNDLEPARMAQELEALL
nr:glycosyltransferase [Gammaproteobacteria bacterium]NIW86411.1 glycosyltransferase [Gammaproteobacteria bacterium]